VTPLNNSELNKHKYAIVIREMEKDIFSKETRHTYRKEERNRESIDGNGAAVKCVYEINILMSYRRILFIIFSIFWN